MTHQKIERSPIWESSSRPLYPKCVWVDGAGYRNFIIDYNIQTRRRSSCQNNSSRSIPLDRIIQHQSFSSDTIDSDGELELVGSSDLRRQLSNHSDDVNTRRPSQCQRHLKSNIQSKSNFQSIKRQLYKRFPRDKVVDTTSDKEASEPEAKIAIGTINQTKDAEHIDLSANQLTERVLQWLDLAGRNTNMHLETEIKPHQRRRICTTDTIMKKTNIRHTSAGGELHQPLKRAESLHHLSLTFGQNENVSAALSFGEFLPSTCRLSRTSSLAGRLSANNNANQQNSKTSSRPPSAVVVPTSSFLQPLLAKNDIKVRNCIDDENERKKIAATTIGSSRKQDKNIENQYQTLIQRQILEKSCNTQLAKRQLHIFMPNLPKKNKPPPIFPPPPLACGHIKNAHTKDEIDEEWSIGDFFAECGCILR